MGFSLPSHPHLDRCIPTIATLLWILHHRMNLSGAPAIHTISISAKLQSTKASTLALRLKSTAIAQEHAYQLLPRYNPVSWERNGSNELCTGAPILSPRQKKRSQRFNDGNKITQIFLAHPRRPQVGDALIDVQYALLQFVHTYAFQRSPYKNGQSSHTQRISNRKYVLINIQCPAHHQQLVVLVRLKPPLHRQAFDRTGVDQTLLQLGVYCLDQGR